MKGLTFLLILVLLVACAPTSEGTDLPPATAAPTATSPTATSQPVASPTPMVTLPPTPTAYVGPWTMLPGGEDLLQHASWNTIGYLRAGTLEIESADNYTTVHNENGLYLNVTGNFGIVATLESAAGDKVYLTLFGVLPQGEWWQGMRRLDVGLDPHNQQIDVNYWDGSSATAKLSESYPFEGLSNQVEVRVRRVHEQIVLIANDTEIARLDDLDLFPDDRVYLGANVMPNSKLVMHSLGVETEPGQAANVELVDLAASYSPSNPALRSLAQARGLTIGAAIAPGPLRGEVAYAQALAHEFSSLTPENVIKFGRIHPQPDRYSFVDPDAMVEFALENDMIVHGHTLVWHQQLSSWVEEGDWTRETLMAVLREHIMTIVGRYKGQVAVWDVVNEALTDNGNMRQTVWYTGIGPDYIDLAFQWAHEADPDAVLIYNDYNVKNINGKSDGMYELVQGMVERGVPIHGVGFQIHISSGANLQEASILENMQRFADLGLEVQITELDVRIKGDPTPAKLERQAETYRQVMDLCLAADNCTTFIMWGFTDRYSWIPSKNPGFGHALIFDAEYQPKPAYDALRDALVEAE